MMKEILEFLKKITGRQIAITVIGLNILSMILFAGFDITWWSDLKPFGDGLRFIGLLVLHIGSAFLAFMHLLDLK